jgi:hypothetical protein
MNKLDQLRLIEFMMDVNCVLAGIALFYWAKPIAVRSRAYLVGFFRRFPKLKVVPGYRNTEAQDRTVFIFYRLCGAFLFFDASYYLLAAIGRFWR